MGRKRETSTSVRDPILSYCLIRFDWHMPRGDGCVICLGTTIGLLAAVAIWGTIGWVMYRLGWCCCKEPPLGDLNLDERLERYHERTGLDLAVAPKAHREFSAPYDRLNGIAGRVELLPDS